MPALDAWLGPEGAFARALEGFHVRPGQLELAEAVRRALEEDTDLIAEAGTGVGKTYAYLVPALLSKRRVLVSTGTKALQDQLYRRDLPRVRTILDHRGRVALLKGRANYLCRYRLERTLKDGRLGARTEVEHLARIRTWAARTASGDRSELAQVPEDSAVWPQVTSTTDNCLGGECPHFDDCFVVKARRSALDADLVVINHHLLFADAALKQDGFGELLPQAEAIVVDEAHQLPDTALQFFGERLSQRGIVELLRDVEAECAAVAGALAALRAPIQDLRDGLKHLRAALDALPPRGPAERWRDHPPAATGLDALARGLELLAQALLELEGASSGLDQAARRNEELRAVLERWREAESASSGWVRWYEVSGQGFTLHRTPLEAQSALGDYRRQTRARWILTSATLTIAGRFDHFLDQVGFHDAITLTVDSPFDYPQQGLLYLPRGLPDPNAADYTDAVVETSLPVLDASAGRAFLLFTSHRALRRAAELLANKTRFPLFVQGSAPRPRLLEDFLRSGNGVLLGAASFWEGIDVPGQALSLVVIDKLPFAQIQDPVLEARIDAARRAGRNPFLEIQLPDAVLALKQGAGRLIRTNTDRGVLVLCDPRLYTRPYGRVFLDSLPPFRRCHDLEAVRDWFAQGSGATGPAAPG